MKKLLMMMAAVMALGSCQESMEKRAERDAQEFTEKKCPMPLDPEGRLLVERAVFDVATHEWKQDFLMKTDSGTTIDAELLRPGLLDELKNSPNYQPYMDNGFSFRYVFLSMDNRADTLADLTLTQQDYSK